MSTHITSFGLDADDGEVRATISVSRVPDPIIGRRVDLTPDVRDVPEDMRRALIKWLGGIIPGDVPALPSYEINVSKGAKVEVHNHQEAE